MYLFHVLLDHLLTPAVALQTLCRVQQGKLAHAATKQQQSNKAKAHLNGSLSRVISFHEIVSSDRVVKKLNKNVLLLANDLSNVLRLKSVLR